MILLLGSKDKNKMKIDLGLQKVERVSYSNIESAYFEKVRALLIEKGSE